MALTDAQAKIIAQNKKKKEEEEARKLAAAMLVNATRPKSTPFPTVTPSKVAANQVTTPLKDREPTDQYTPKRYTTTRKTTSLLSDMGSRDRSILDRMRSDSGRLYTPLDVIRDRISIGDTAQTLAYRARQQDNDSWQERLQKAAEERIKRQEELSKYTLSEADQKLPSHRKQMVLEAKDAWQKAKDAGDLSGMSRTHQKAESVRNWAGYSGGAAGDEFIEAQLTKDDMAHLNQDGQNKLKKAMLDRQKAIHSGDVQAQMKASAEIQRIRNSSIYKNQADNADAYGRPMMTGEERLQDAARAMAGVKSVGTGVAGSLLSLAETGNQAMRNYTRDRWGHVLEANANQYEDPLLAQKARARLGESTIVDPNLPGQSLMRKSQEYAAEALDGTSGVEKFLGEAALSVGQNLPGIALSMIPGAQGAGLALLGAQAAGARAWELNEQTSQAFLASLILGGDPEDYGSVEPGEALLRGLASGGVELLTEKIPLDNLAKILRGKSGQNGLKSILKQMGIEGVEEGTAYTANFLLDKIAQDPNAEWTVEEFLKNAAIGAVSGGAMAGGATALRGAAEASRYAPSASQLQERTVESVLRNQAEEPTQEQIPSETKASDNEVRTEARTAHEAAEEPVEVPRGQEATTLPEARMTQPVQVREAQVTTPAIQQQEQQKKGKHVKLKRIEAIPAEVEVVQSKRVAAPVVFANYLSEMSSTLGKSGSKAMQVAWDGKGNQAQYAADFIRVYNQALTGTSTGRIQAPDSLSDVQVQAAYDAGKNDRQLSLEEAKTAAQFAPVAGKDSGLVYDDYVKAEMDTAVASEINTVAKQLGLRVQMVDSVKGGEANADIQGSVVRIEKGNPHPVRFLFGHEMTHRVQELAPESYREFRDFVMSSPKAQDEVQSKLAAYKSRGVDIDSEGAIDEIVADYAGQLIESKDLMKRFIDQNRKNQSMLSRFLTALKDLAAKLTGRRKAQVNDAVALMEKAVGDAAKQAKKLEKGGNASQTGMVYDDGNGHSRYSLKTYREGGRDTLGRWLADRVKAGDLDGRDAKDMIKEMDRIYDICEKYTDVYAPFGKWSEAEVVRDDNGDPVFSVVKANGDYPMNMDFSLVCKKRRPLDAVLNSLVEQGLAEKFALDKESIVVLNDIIRRHGFETACSLCFVDAKRFRVTEVADQFASMYNKLVRSMVPKGKDYQVASFNFGGDKTVKKVSGGIDTMQDGDLNFKEIEKTIRTTGEKSVAHKIAVHLRDNPADRKLVRRGDFISTAGFDRVKKDNPALLSLYNSKKGSAGPKASFSDVQYLSEVLEQKFFKRDAAYAVGGVRIQSFSDYMPRLFFDYAQMIADLAAKKLPAHGYTKEALFAQQFGQTGVKINLSLVPKVVEGGVAPGLDANGNYVWQEGQSFGSAVSDKDNGKAGFDLAVQIQNAEGYGDNCGTIAVGVSDRHIEKMLDDPDIRMIIPYHKSGLNPVVAAMNKIDKFENYTNYQNTRSKKTGKKVDAHFDFNTELQKLGDAKAAADAYLAWCEENGYLPKFDIPSRKFFPSQHPNYYKLLIDFSAYNSDGKATPQGDVRIQYPQEGDAFGSLNDLIKQGLEEDALAQAKLDKGVKPILDDVEKELSARSSLKGISGYENLVEKFGAIEQGEDPRARDIQVPKQTEDGKKVSRTVRTILEAGSTTDEMVPTIKKMVEDGEFSYDVAGDKAAIETAEATIRDKGFQAALMDWTSSLAKGEVNKQNVATGWALYDAAAQAGDAKTAADIMTRIVIHQRNAAQAVQATRILKRMSPSAQLYGIQRSVQNMQEELNTKYGDKAPNLKVPDELIERYLNAENQEERDEAEIEIYKAIGKQMPSTFQDKWNAWRYLAMLFNVRTHLRNITGNAVFAIPVSVKNVVGTVVESSVSAVSGGKIQRTKGVATPELVSAAWADYKKAEPQIMAGGKYDDSAAKKDIIQDNRVIFRTRFVEWLRKMNSGALQAEDGWACRPHYANALAQYCSANGITAEQIRTGEGVDKKAIDKARGYAIREAQKATFRDFNDFSNYISSLGRYEGKSPTRKAVSVLAEGLFPFRKTPANIMARAVEYSPANLANVVAELVYNGVKAKKGKKQDMLPASQIIDNFASGLTGTGLFAFGAYLASQGLLIASEDDDDKQAAFDKLLGRQTNAVELKDGSNFTIDWMAPQVIPVLMGAEFFQVFRENDESASWQDLINAISTVTNPMLELSCLSSLNDTLDALTGFVEGDVSSLVTVAVDIAVGYLTQGIPTLFGQGERSSQEERMTTYTDKNLDTPPDWQYTIGQISAKIPGWDYNQIPYIDAWGRTENEGTLWERILSNFINPAYTSKYAVSNMEAELQRLYDATGEGVFPQRAERKLTINGTDVDLTAEQYIQYATMKGKESQRLLIEMTSSSWYAALGDAEKAQMISDALAVARESAKLAVFPEYESKNTAFLKASSLEKDGIPAGEFLMMYGIAQAQESSKTVDDETISDSLGYNKLMALRNSGMLDKYDEEQQKKILGAVDVGEKLQSMSEDALAKLATDIEEQMNAPSFYSNFPDSKRDLVKGLEEYYESATSEYDSKGKAIDGKGRQDKFKAEIRNKVSSGELTAHEAYLVFHRFYDSDKNNPWAYAKNG